MSLPAIRREVLVEADPAFAFEVFTEQIGHWWPLEDLGVHGKDASLSFEDRDLVERSPSGEKAVWGTVTDWQPGSALSFTWHPGRDEAKASHVTVTFHSRGERTLVVLEHTGWEVFADPQAARAEYDHGWPAVLAHFLDHVAETRPWTWVALMHTPGPTAPVDGSVFADPRFAEHVAFLQRMKETGYLIAAGPLGTDGSGMTILRLPGAGRAHDATHLANNEDQAVLSGLLKVDARPWNVLLHTPIRSRPLATAPRGQA
jgi:uncharacterized protein YndB with AHSA1/START domain/uncharacterized protein YciI